MRIRSLFMAASIASMSGCYVNTIKTGLPAGPTVVEKKAKFYIMGVVGEETFDLQQICPDGVAEIKESQEFADAVMQCITCGIYVPVTVKIRCASGAAYRLTPDEAQGGSWVEPTASFVPPTTGDDS